MIDGAGSGWAAPPVPVTAVAPKAAMLVRALRRETPHAQPEMQRSKRMAPSLIDDATIYRRGPRRLRCGFIFGSSGHITRAEFTYSERYRRLLWPAIPNSRTSCTARGGR